jgi:hypothetical protein
MSSAIIVVSGLPRSGTSLMMQMLGSGGVALFTDGARVADEDNPRGYFECEAAKRLKHDSSWLGQARGKAVKIVHLLLPELPPAHEYRVILMRREMAEVLASQQAMLDRAGRAGSGLSGARLAEVFTRQLEAVERWLAARPNVRTLPVEHRRCLQEPAEVAAAVERFLERGLNREAMAQVVDRALYRHISPAE